MKNVLFLSSWFPSRVHTTLGNFVKYHAHSSAKFNNIFVSPRNRKIAISLKKRLTIDSAKISELFFKLIRHLANTAIIFQDANLEVYFRLLCQMASQDSVLGIS